MSASHTPVAGRSAGGTGTGTPTLRSIGSASNLNALQQQAAGGSAQQQAPSSQSSSQQQQPPPPLQSSQSSKSLHSTKAGSHPFHSVAQGPWVPPTLHVCPGPAPDDQFDDQGEWATEEGEGETEGDSMDESDWDGSSDGDEEFLSPPLIPPFRFATVESARAVLVREAAAQASSSSSSSSGAGQPPPLRSVKSIASLPSTSSLTSLVSMAASAPQLPLPLPLHTLSSASVSSGQSTPNSSAGAVATPPLSASTPGRNERRMSIGGSMAATHNWATAAAALTTANHSTAGSLAGGAVTAAAPASSAQSSGTSTPRTMLPAAALTSAHVAASAGVPVQPVPSPPTSPSRAHSTANASASASSTTLSAAAAASASHTGRHVCMRGLPDHSLYRGAYPTLKNFHFLSRLRLRSIVSLTPEAPTADLRLFCREGGGTAAYPSDPTPVRLFHFPVAQCAENVAVSHAQAVAIVQVLIDADNLPAFVHCTDGCNNTSIIIACLRKVQGWTLAPIWGEMLRFTVESSGIMDAEREFVERFNHHGLVAPPIFAGAKDAHNAGSGSTAAAATAAAAAKAAAALSTPNNLLIRVPASLPSWLWGGIHLAAHPLGLKLYDAHVPAFLSLHSKLLSALDPVSIAAAASAATSSGSTPAAGSVAAAATVLASHAGWRLLPEDSSARALWDGVHLHDPLPAGGETEKERKKREKKEGKASKAEKDAREKGVEEAVESVREKDKRTVGAAQGRDGDAQSSKPQAAPAADADALVGALAAGAAGAAGGGGSKAKGKGGKVKGENKDAPDAAGDASVIDPGKKKKNKQDASSPDSGPAPAPSTSASSSASAATAVAASPPLSHPGEFHSLVDLDKSHWGKDRSSLAADILFIPGSFHVGPAPGAGMSLAGGGGGGGEDGPASVRGNRDTLPLLQLAEEQFVEHPEDLDEQFTRDEFDGDVSLLLASLALEGFTMNHKITRPMQLFHADQGQA